MSERKDKIMSKGGYTLFTGTSTEDNQLCYKIINNTFGVVEAETRILPQAYKFLEDLSAALDGAIALEEEDSNKHVPGSLRLVKKDEQL